MHTIRVWFAKRDEACYISHLDLQRVVQRALKLARVPVWYTQGFNPHIYLTFACLLYTSHRNRPGADDAGGQQPYPGI